MRSTVISVAAWRILRVLVPCLLGVGCTGGADAPVDKYADATLVTGAGLGDLELGTTTLGQFLTRVPNGRVIIAASDESAFEYRFHGNQLAVQFIIAGECSRQVWATRDLRKASPNIEPYLASHPACRDLPLTSIPVGTGSTPWPRFYQGHTEHGVKLGDVATAAAAHGASKPAMPRQVAGLSQDNPENVLEFPGMLVYYSAGSSGKIEDTSIRRITLFVEPRP